MQRNRFERDRNFGTAVFQHAVVTDDQVFQLMPQSGGKLLAGGGFGFRDLFAQALDANDDVSNELPPIGVADLAAGTQFVDLPQVVQEGSHQQQVRVDLGISR